MGKLDYRDGKATHKWKEGKVRTRERGREGEVGRETGWRCSLILPQGCSWMRCKPHSKSSILSFNRTQDTQVPHWETVNRSEIQLYLWVTHLLYSKLSFKTCPLVFCMFLKLTFIAVSSLMINSIKPTTTIIIKNTINHKSFNQWACIEVPSVLLLLLLLNCR